MTRTLVLTLLLAASAALAAETPEKSDAVPTADATATEVTETAPAESQEGPKHISGMSILGNQEAPKSLIIVPWRSSELGDSLGIATLLDESRQPVDREVFMRALTYYEIRSETTP